MTRGSHVNYVGALMDLLTRAPTKVKAKLTWKCESVNFESASILNPWQLILNLSEVVVMIIYTTLYFSHLFRLIDCQQLAIFVVILDFHIILEPFPSKSPLGTRLCFGGSKVSLPFLIHQHLLVLPCGCWLALKSESTWYVVEIASLLERKWKEGHLISKSESSAFTFAFQAELVSVKNDQYAENNILMHRPGNDYLRMNNVNAKVPNEKRNKCNQCPYETTKVSHLRSHLITHSGKKANKCNQCDFASSQTGSLGRHLKTHSGEKSNKCNQCYLAFAQASHLISHLKIHSGEKSHKCIQCN